MHWRFIVMPSRHKGKICCLPAHWAITNVIQNEVNDFDTLLQKITIGSWWWISMFGHYTGFLCTHNKTLTASCTEESLYCLVCLNIIYAVTGPTCAFWRIYIHDHWDITKAVQNEVNNSIFWSITCATMNDLGSKCFVVLTNEYIWGTYRGIVYLIYSRDFHKCILYNPSTTVCS